jgi:hypothetical protein
MGMADSTQHEAQRRREAVQREMQRLREADDERDRRELLDTVEDEQERERAGDD